MSNFTAVFSHEFDAGSSGPARSYWDIRRGNKSFGGVCLLPRRNMSISTAEQICQLLDIAYAAGSKDKAREMRDVLGCK